jgi:hypothetical protein
MVGRAQLDSLQLRKQALILESELNRIALRAESQNLRSATKWVGHATQTCRKLPPWLLLLAPVAGFLVVRSLRRPASALSRFASMLKWVQPLYSLWRGFTAGQP